MKKIGITGGIGSGKTYVSKVFESLGIPVFNADIEAKKLMSSSSDLIQSIKYEFGNDIFDDYILTKKTYSIYCFFRFRKVKKIKFFSSSYCKTRVFKLAVKNRKVHLCY